jgi:hypothetical protein
MIYFNSETFNAKNVLALNSMRRRHVDMRPKNPGNKTAKLQHKNGCLDVAIPAVPRYYIKISKRVVCKVLGLTTTTTTTTTNEL